ncbi:MAG TPA: hypothetical protein VKN63_11690, partial [Afifellaceae bacterium]|nr:hypothetical protein [Afifellaceae bacterium]
MRIQTLKVSIAAAFGASCVILAGQPVQAAPEGKLAEQMQLSLVPEGGKFLSVISDDGKTYNRFKPGSYVPYHGNIKIKMRRGLVRGWSIYWGFCDDDDCNNFIGNGFLYGVFEGGAKLVEKQISIPLFADAIPGGQGGLNPNPTAAQIISRCNQAAEGAPPNKAHEFGESVPVSLGVDTYIAVGFGSSGSVEGLYQVDDVDKAKTIDIALPIRCEPLQSTPVAAGDVQTELPELELVATDLALQKGQDLPAASLTHAGSCPIGITLHVGATTNIKGKVHGYIQHKSADGVNWQSPEFTMTTSSTDGALWKKVWTDLQQLPFQQAGVPFNPGGGGVVDNQPSNGLQ